jgi:DNA polymerase-3 subunit delta'
VQQERLVAAADAERMHHAYLLEGPEGVGKGTFARWIARYVNCEREERPCGACRSCHLMLSGTHPDLLVVEPDPTRATRVITVDQAHQLIRALQLQRHSARRRFVILDPADTLNEDSANALLKTLEEPPRGTQFLLLTARVASLLPTIRSRTQRLRFGPVDEAPLAAWLGTKGLDPDLARRSGGSPGFALRLAAGEGDERREVRDALLGAVGQPLGRLFAFTEAEGKKEEGVSRAALAVDVLEELLCDTGRVALGHPPLHGDARPVLTQWAAALWPGGQARLSGHIASARDRLRLNVNGRVVLEALLTQLNLELSAARPR